MYTGKVIIVEKDINPNSPTYGQTRERLEDSELCTHWRCEMQKVNTYASEGVWYEVYADKNPTSPTYGKTITIERGSTDPFYLEMYSRCEQLRYHEDFVANSGYKVATNIDANPNSSTYQQPIENVRSLSLIDCARPNTNQIIEDEVACELVDFPSGQKGTNGVEVVKGYDVNPYSTTYYEKVYEYRRASKDCFAPDTAPNVIVACEFCEVNQQGKTTGYKFIKQKDINLFSATYDAEWQLVKVADTDMCKREVSILRGTGVPNSSFDVVLDSRSVTINIDANGNWEYQFLSNPKGSVPQFVKSNKQDIYSIDFSMVDTSEMNLYDLFYGLTSLVSFNFEGCDLSGTDSTHAMFFDCKSITEVDLSGLSIHTTISRDMFRDCEQVTKINMSGFDTTDIYDVTSMFNGCLSLTEVDLSGWDLTNCSSDRIKYVFYKCDSLRTIYARGCNATTLMKLAAIKPTYANIVTT